MARYILNSAVITSEGVYEYKLISVEEAKKWLETGEFVSTIGYEETAKALELITGVKVDVNRKQVKMDKDDEALIFRLTCRLDNPALKGNMSIDFVLNNCEIGLLKRLM
jgi:rhamnose utilization protein RhaD (predicted bifunctional aldolase and dehydrogenase)